MGENLFTSCLRVFLVWGYVFLCLRRCMHLHSKKNKACIFLKLPGSVTPDERPWDCNYSTPILALFILSQIVFPYNNILHSSAPLGLPCPRTFYHQRRAKSSSRYCKQWRANVRCSVTRENQRHPNFCVAYITLCLIFHKYPLWKLFLSRHSL